MIQKNNSVPSAETKDDSSNVADVTTSSPNNAKPLVGGCGSLKPILFKTEMVQAILEGRKTQTRRIINVPSSTNFAGFVIGDTKRNDYAGFSDINNVKIDFLIKPKYKVGDVLWVRETWNNSLNPNEYCYKADTDNPIYLDKQWKWKPSLFMPLNACRLFLKVTNVRIERLNDISESDAINEGISESRPAFGWKNYIDNSLFFDKKKQYNNTPSSVMSFATLWFEVNGKESWEQNPFVWVIEFERCQIP